MLMDDLWESGLNHRQCGFSSKVKWVQTKLRQTLDLVLESGLIGHSNY